MAKQITNKVEFVTFDAKSSYIFSSQKDEVQRLIAEYNSEGYEVQSVTPITSGESDYSTYQDQVYGYGFGYTSALMIVFKRAEKY